MARADPTADAAVLTSGPLDPPPSVDVATDTQWTIGAAAGFPIGSVRDLMLLVTYTAKMPTAPP